MNVRDLTDFDPMQWSYVGSVAEYINEGFAADTDPAKRGFLASRVAPLFEIAKVGAVVKVSNEWTKIHSIGAGSCTGLAFAVVHIALAAFSLYEGASWAQTAKEGLTAPLTMITTPIAAYLLVIDLFAGFASLVIPAVGRLVRRSESVLMDWSQKQINAIDGTDKPYDAKTWTFQTRGDLIAEGIASYIVSSVPAVWQEPSRVVTTPLNYTASVISGSVRGSWNCFKAITT